MGRPAEAPSGEDGFSLVEMLVVLAVLALAAVSAGPALDAVLPARRLEAAVETLRAEIDLLRGEALRTGRTTRLAFEPAANRFLSSRPGAAPMPVEAAVRVDVPRGKHETPGEIRFRPDGSASGGRITLTRGHAVRILAVGPLIGLAHRVEAAP